MSVVSSYTTVSKRTPNIIQRDIKVKEIQGAADDTSSNVGQAAWALTECLTLPRQTGSSAFCVVLH